MIAPGSTVLVTGAAGFVGAAVARALAADGFRVRALVRATSPRDNLIGLDAEIVTADLLDAAAVAAACVGADAVIHVAADYRLWARDPEEIVRNNVAQTTQRHARRAGGRRRAGGLLFVGRDTRARPDAGRRDRPADAGPGHRRVQAEQGGRRAPRRGDDRERRPARRDRQPVDPDRPARRPPDADRADHRRGGDGQDPGLRRYRAEPGPRRRRRPRASAGIGERRGRSTLYPRRAGRESRERCSPTSPR